jgi:heptose III glucuronosyltransferase
MLNSTPMPNEEKTPLPSRDHTRLSIITPAYNAAAFLPALAQAISNAEALGGSSAQFAQSAIEWIIIDDGSTDSTAEVLAPLLAQHKNWRRIYQTNAGLSAARNRGINEATGTFIWFVDADDLIVPDAVPDLMRALTGTVDVLSFQAERFGESISPELITHSPPRATTTNGQAWVQERIASKDWKHFAWLYCYRRAFLVDNHIQFTVGMIHEDIVFTTEAHLRASAIHYVDRLAYRYRINEQSITGSRDEQKIMRRIESYFNIVTTLRELNQRFATHASTRRALDGEVIGQAIQIFELAKLIDSPATIDHLRTKCRDARFAQSLFPHAHSWKRFRQVLSIWAKQSGLISIEMRANQT